MNFKTLKKMWTIYLFIFIGFLLAICKIVKMVKDYMFSFEDIGHILFIIYAFCMISAFWGFVLALSLGLIYDEPNSILNYFALYLNDNCNCN